MIEQIEERRREPRVMFTSPVIIRLHLQQIFSDARNLSLTGMSLQTFLRLDDVSCFVSRFMIPRGGIIELDGRVVHQTQLDDWNVVGVEFLDIPRRVARAIRELVEEKRCGAPIRFF